MRNYLDIDLNTQQITSRTLEGEEFAIAGRYFIAKTLLENDVAGVDPLGPDLPHEESP